MRSWWGEFRCLPGSSLEVPITLFGLNAGTCAKNAYEPFKAMEKALRATGYSDVKTAWIPRACPTGISGKTCQSDGTNCSLHNYGIAVDIDPYGQGNPHFQKRFGDGWDFSDCKITRQQVEAVEAIRNVYGEQMFRWLGWSIGDTMHFELQVHPTRTEVDWSTVPGGVKRFEMLAPCKLNDSGSHVKALQIMLKTCGFDPGAIDGNYGPNTSAALLACRQSLPGGTQAVQSGDEFTEWAYENLHRVHSLKFGGGTSVGLTKEQADLLYQASGTIPPHGHKYAKESHSHTGTVVETKEVTLT